MSRLILMQGLPGSGKSTRAKELLDENPHAVRINRDLLRTMLHCDVWSKDKEEVTRCTAHGVALEIGRASCRERV